MAVVWDAAPFSVETDRRFRYSHCLHDQGHRPSEFWILQKKGKLRRLRPVCGRLILKCFENVIILT